jgi:hypothetical protein
VSAASAIAPIARASQVPLLLLAFDPAQVRAAHTAGVAAVLLAHDPALSERLAATLSAIALGEPAPLFPPPIVTETDNGRTFRRPSSTTSPRWRSHPARSM